MQVLRMLLSIYSKHINYFFKDKKVLNSNERNCVIFTIKWIQKIHCCSNVYDTYL